MLSRDIRDRSLLHNNVLFSDLIVSFLTRSHLLKEPLAAASSLTFPFCHETVSRTSGLSSPVRRCHCRRGLMCSHWLVGHCLNPQEFPREGLLAKANPTSPIQQNATDHNVVVFFSSTDCNSTPSQAETLTRQEI